MRSPQEENRLRNVYAKEANKHNIGSPYRIKEYIEYRLRGMSEQKAIARVKQHP